LRPGFASRVQAFNPDRAMVLEWASSAGRIQQYRMRNELLTGSASNPAWGVMVLWFFEQQGGRGNDVCGGGKPLVLRFFGD
jgi:hypothetical protein